jgi:hypothetical protein
MLPGILVMVHFFKVNGCLSLVGQVPAKSHFTQADSSVISDVQVPATKQFWYLILPDVEKSELGVMSLPV